MKLITKLALLFLTFASLSAFAEERDYDSFYYLTQGKMTTQASGMGDVVIAFDEKAAEFVWKDFGPEVGKTEWAVVGKDILDPLLREIKTIEDLKVIDEHEGTYWKIRKLTDTKSDKIDVGLDLGLRLNGGGPGLAVLCGVVCKTIGTLGCGFGGYAIGAANPVLGILYAGVCSALDSGGTASCVALCLGLPTP